MYVSMFVSMYVSTCFGRQYGRRAAITALQVQGLQREGQVEIGCRAAGQAVRHVECKHLRMHGVPRTPTRSLTYTRIPPPQQHPQALADLAGSVGSV